MEQRKIEFEVWDTKTKKCEGKECESHYLANFIEDVEKIGNIFENPELLKKIKED